MKQNDNKIVLSICIPTYNRKTLLKEIKKYLQNKTSSHTPFPVVYARKT